MMWQIGGAIGKVISVEEREWVYEESSGGNGDKEGDDRMARCVVTVSRKSMSERMLWI